MSALFPEIEMLYIPVLELLRYWLRVGIKKGLLWNEFSNLVVLLRDFHKIVRIYTSLMVFPP